MKISVLVCHVLLLLFIIGQSTSCKGAEAQQHQGPHIVFESTEVDLGTIPQNGEFEFSFNFSNAGTNTLEILSTKVSCGCTIVEEGAQILQPGESGLQHLVRVSRLEISAHYTTDQCAIPLLSQSI